MSNGQDLADLLAAADRAAEALNNVSHLLETLVDQRTVDESDPGSYEPELRRLRRATRDSLEELPKRMTKLENEYMGTEDCLPGRAELRRWLREARDDATDTSSFFTDTAAGEEAAVEAKKRAQKARTWARRIETFFGVKMRFHVFLSYSHLDQSRAESLRRKLLKRGFRVFKADKSIHVGDDFLETIKGALRQSREMWLLLTPNSKASSWVSLELTAAWALQKKIIILLCGCKPEEVPEPFGRIHCDQEAEVEKVILQLCSRHSVTPPPEEMGHAPWRLH